MTTIRRWGGGVKGRVGLIHAFEDIISIENLLESWKEFMSGKRRRIDVQEFSLHLMEHVSKLHDDLIHHTYRHGPYQAFRINDPKPRHIHKSSVRDRLLHHAIYRILYPFFDRTFIADSYSCRLAKGTYKAMGRFKSFALKESRNHTRTVWVLKCDVRKFFDSIDHEILIRILKKHVSDDDIIVLLENIIKSFQKMPGRGLPLGNLTSQLFVNIYMNEFDQWMKHHMKAKYYIRYADDFVILSHDKDMLEELLSKIGDFLSERLKLDLHPDKVFIKTLTSGIDFLGWVHFSDHRVLRTSTRRRMMKKIAPENRRSYLGLISHGNTNKLRKELESIY